MHKKKIQKLPESYEANLSDFAPDYDAELILNELIKEQNYKQNLNFS